MNIGSNIVNTISSPKARNLISKLGSQSELLPVILLESTVTGGRTLQAYKRSGKSEARERLIEESTGAVVWLFGVDTLQKIGKKIGKKYLNIPDDFDVGRDALRTPFKNTIKQLDEAAKAGAKVPNKNLIAAYKFSNVALSVLLATSFIGFVMPKINHKITNMIKSKQAGQADNQTALPPAQMQATNVSTGMALDTIDSFKQKVSNQQNKPSFKGANLADGALHLAYLLENHPVGKLMSTDVGMLAGRTKNARNADERIEIGFRDGVSIYFYMFARKHVAKLLEKIGDYGKVARINPNTANTANELLSESIKEPMSLADYNKKIMASMSDSNKKIFDNIKFNDDVITLDDLKKVIPENLHKKALEMSKLQPQQALDDKWISVLSKRQVQDVLSDGESTSPKFLMKMYKSAFGDKLTDSRKYISMNDINKFRDNIDFYLDGIATYAKNKADNVVDKSVLKAIKDKNLLKSAGFFGAGFLVSAAFLSTLIPKMQYMITKIRTGKNEFPGMEAPENNTKKA